MSHYRVAYTFIGDQNRLRSGAVIVDAKDVPEARKMAEAQFKKEGTTCQIGRITPWGPQ